LGNVLNRPAHAGSGDFFFAADGVGTKREVPSPKGGSPRLSCRGRRRGETQRFCIGGLTRCPSSGD
jgi:hypothetical protein